MATSLGSALSRLIPLALVIALSPLSIIPAVLVLHSPRPRPSGLAFLTGWFVGLTAMTAFFVAASDGLAFLHKSPPTWASWVRVVLGSALIGFGVYRWVTRHSHSEMPGWMRSLEGVTPGRAALLGALLAVVRPEVLLVCAAAGLTIGGPEIGASGSWTAAVIFVVVAASSVAVPIVAYAGAGDRLDEPLARLKNWMDQHNAALVAAVVVLIGALVFYHGINALSQRA
ncbi:MAG TPA: GAP family protein [Mycobacterium sp.]|nr:GAP family protein [Mycobacterium sp.]